MVSSGGGRATVHGGIAEGAEVAKGICSEPGLKTRPTSSGVAAVGRVFRPGTSGPSRFSARSAASGANRVVTVAACLPAIRGKRGLSGRAEPLLHCAPVETESRQVLAQPIGVVRDALLFPGPVEQDASGGRQARRVRADPQDVVELRAIEAIEILAARRRQ